MERHHLNTEFEWKPHRGPFRIVSEAQARQYDEQGYFVFEDVFDAETIQTLIEAIDPIEAELEQMIRDKYGGKALIARADEITFTAHLVAQSEVARAFTRHRFFCDIVHDLIGPDVRLYWDQSVYKKPGTKAPFPWHQDNGYTFVEPQQYLTCWVALTDATEENGCPWVLPGKHHMGTYAHELSDLGFVCAREPEGAVPAPARAGSVVVFSSLTPHATGANVSDSTRKSYIVQFAPDGAERISEVDGQLVREQANAPERQYPILVNGEVPA